MQEIEVIPVLCREKTRISMPKVGSSEVGYEVSESKGLVASKISCRMKNF